MTTITINVCGKIFETDLITITKSVLFKNVIDDTGIPDKPIFINRSPKLFEHVLAYIIDENYPFPMKYRSELDYFLIDYDPTLLYNPDTKIEQMKSDIKKLEEKINKEELHFFEYELTTCINCFKPAIPFRCEDHIDDPRCAAGYCRDICDVDKMYCDYHCNYKKCAVNNCRHECRPEKKYCYQHQEFEI